MKKSDFRSLIREAIKKTIIESYSKKMLTEKFAAKSAAKLANKLSGSDKQFFQGMANTYDIDWANAPETAFGTKANPAKNMINFFFVKSRQKNPYSGYNDWDVTIYPGLIGVTRGKEKLHVSQGKYELDQFTGKRKKSSGVSGEKTAKGGYRGRSDRDAMGQALKNLHNYKRFNEVAEEVITIDLNKLPSAKELKQSRADARYGATALQSAKTMASQNRQRYEKLLTDRLANSSPGDQIVKMVDAVTKMYKDSVDKSLAMLKKKKVSSGWNDSATKIQRAYSSIMQEFKYYLRAENDVVKGAERDKAAKLKSGDKAAWSEEKYYQKQMLKYARSIQKYYKELKTDLSKIDKSKDFIDLT